MQMDKMEKLRYEADVLTLIKMVQSRPCLWDKSNGAFKEVSERMKAWSDICQHFEPSFPEMEESEQNKMVHFIQGKWQNTRDTFMKSKKKNCFTKYRYHDQLTFLLKNLETDEKQSPSSSSATAPQEKTRDKNDSTAKRIKRSYMRTTPDGVRRKDRKNKLKNSSSSLPMILSRNDEEFVNSMETRANYATQDCSISRVHVNPSPDEDEAFFLSVLPSIRRLSEDDKLEFRMGVLSTIREIKRRAEMTEASNASPQYSGLLFVSEADLPQIKDCPSE